MPFPGVTLPGVRWPEQSRGDANSVDAVPGARVMWTGLTSPAPNPAGWGVCRHPSCSSSGSLPYAGEIVHPSQMRLQGRRVGEGVVPNLGLEV